jgi:hemerythrin
VQLLNDTYDEYVVGINMELPVMDHLLAYMNFCFECEEQWMVKASYPDAEHKEEHALFSRRLVEIHKNFRQDANTSIEILMFFEQLGKLSLPTSYGRRQQQHFNIAPVVLS